MVKLVGEKDAKKKRKAMLIGLDYRITHHT
ncbi:Uncharacterised protein [uncultured archaeon]|nr:Uncharacterised protein [uncultured archaeon]